MTQRLMDDLIASWVTLLRQRSRGIMTGSESDSKIKYMREEEESPGEKMVVGGQGEEKSRVADLSREKDN